MTFDFANTVTRIHEDVARHQAVRRRAVGGRSTPSGAHVDELLDAGDVRLTMGGEPTFVSVDDMEAAEWTVDADGPHKRERATDLAERLQATDGRRTAMVHQGQGKWYPGEPLPRWADRADLAQGRRAAVERPRAARRPVGAGVEADGRGRRPARLALWSTRLGAPVECCLPAYEDTVRAAAR